MKNVRTARINGWTDEATGVEHDAEHAVLIESESGDRSEVAVYGTANEARIHANVLTSTFPTEYAVAYPPKGEKGKKDEDESGDESGE